MCLTPKLTLLLVLISLVHSRKELETGHGEDGTIILALKTLHKGQEDIYAKIEEQQHSILVIGDQVASIQKLVMTDECRDGSHNCSEYAICKDACPRYTCTCLAGFTGDGFTCNDIDECVKETHSCGDDSSCENTIGSYNCPCMEGFRKSKGVCQDIDECTEMTHTCGHGSSCKNSKGSFSCPCQDGFQQVNGLCQDIDECTTLVHECEDNSRCINTEGNYTCGCNQYFRGDGRMCTGPHCMAPFTSIIGMDCFYVVTSLLSWHEAQENCQSWAGRLLTDLTKAQMTAMSYHLSGELMWVGVRYGEWAGSRRSIPSNQWGRGEPIWSNKQCGALDYSVTRIRERKCSDEMKSICQQLY